MKFILVWEDPGDDIYPTTHCIILQNTKDLNWSWTSDKEVATLLSKIQVDVILWKMQHEVLPKHPHSKSSKFRVEKTQ